MTFYRSMARSLAAHGVSVCILQGSAFLSGHRDQQIVNGVSVETLETRRLEAWIERLPQLAMMPILRRSLAAAFAMWEQAEAHHDHDVVEATDFGFLALPWTIHGNCPIVNQMHASAGQIAMRDPILGLEVEGYLSLSIDIAIAEAASAIQSSSFANCSFWQTQTFRPTDCIRPAWKAAAHVQDSPSSSRVVVMGRVQRWKGPHILCEALRLMGDRSPGVDWYGRDTSYEEFGVTAGQWLAATYPDVWGKQIIHHPTVPSETVPKIQSSALLNIVPSTWDVFNFTAVEAMASGRPVICSDGAGASELLIDGVTGFIYAADDPAALATAIESAMALSPARQIEMGAAAREAIRVVLDPATIARQRIDAYEKAIASGNIARPIPDWLVDLCKPGDAARSQLAFLDHLPLKSIARYAAERTLRKIFRQ